ncbi:hypothetical protein AGR3A_Lc180023 [Agrobacterium tomkonis CFBP 6623]|uniref:Uncharacterized protein n=1 Tax=Agrobacterium tomkonis CFBP 6623 TaxID=1183432 RepID=A0A1S7S1I1_9HYPH|nr:hypothetical protein AGR3A_Lc180023 [Agrobacterium tomkonis CFBP 6623]
MQPGAVFAAHESIIVKPPALNIDGSLQCFGDGVFRPAELLLCVAGNLFGLAFRLKSPIAGDFPGCFLDGALCLAGNAFDAVFVHDVLLPPLDHVAADNGMMGR